MTTRRRKACVECRQQKIRCDVEQHKMPLDPCSRCKKMNIECRILPTSTRNLRQTKAEMRKELEELRWNLRHSKDQVHVFSTPASTEETGNTQDHFPPDHGSASHSHADAGRDGSASKSTPFNNGPSGTSARKFSQPQTATLPRVLEGYIVDAKSIEDCFTLFFSQYHVLLPILDPSLTPNDYHDLSPFLFWSIIVTGSRRYSMKPTILDRISQLIIPLAFSSMALRSTPIPVIQGLLILCTWRFPTNSMYKDMTHVLCGAAVHLATQIGLHVAGVGQDFARMPLRKDRDQKIFRARLWIYCVIVSIRSSCGEGIPPLVIADFFFNRDETDREDLLTCIPANLQFLHKVHVILLRAMSAMIKTDLKSIDCDTGVLRSLISIFDDQLHNLTPNSPSELDKFQLNCARIHVLAFHFFAHPTNPGPDLEAMSRLYSLCISTLQTADTLARTANFAVVCPSFIDRTVTLIGFAILKIARSPLACHLDLVAGEQAYSSAVQFSKNISLQKNDLGARSAAIMTNLWDSSKVFRRKDGRLESLGLRLRTRLSMSVSFDMFWYWREEFGNMSNPYNGDENMITSNAQMQPTTPQNQKQDVAHARTFPAPVPKYTPVTSVDTPQQSAGREFESSNVFEYSVLPTIDQFPEYDWAASFNFSSGWDGTDFIQMPPDIDFTREQL